MFLAEARLDRPDRGEYRLAGEPVRQMDGDSLAAARNRRSKKAPPERGFSWD